MSGGFYERLSAISSDPSSPDSMTELVVAALGSFGRYYICWKTQSGEYRQESSGLPAPLQEWLFPSEEGQQRTRDFATLQVVLGHGDDFFAADRDGKIERKAASSSAASTPDRTASPQPNNDRQYLSPSPMSNRPLDRAARRRSRTMSLIGPPASSFRLSQAVSPISEFPGDPSRGGHGARGSSISMSSIGAGQRLSGSGVKAVARPLAVARTNADWRTRPRTIALGEEQLRIPEGGLRAREQVPLRARGASSPPQPPLGMGRGEVGGGGGGSGGGGAACCQCGCHATAQTSSSSAAAAMQTTTGVREQRPSYATASVQAKVEPADPPPPPPPRPQYVDTAVQTDPPPRVRRSPSSSSRKRHSVTSSYSDTGTFPSSNYSSYLSSTSSRRSSAAATDITTPSTYEGGAPSGNPVLMGKMQDYFRSTGYQLGDALRPTQYGVGYGVGYGGIETGWFSAW